MRRLLSLGTRVIEVVIGHDDGPPRGAPALPAETLARARLAPDDRGVLRALLSAADPSASVARLDDDDVLARLTTLVRLGALTLRDAPLAPLAPSLDSAGDAAGDDDAVDSVAPRETPKTWIEIELVGEDDKPIPYMPYRLVLADGSEQTGSLDSKGFARVDGIDPGQCEVHFPELDQEAWVRI
jgi:hypothetical protein